MYNKVFAILIIIFSIIIIASNDTFAESKNDMMNMKEDKKNTIGPLYPWVPHPWSQPTIDRKYLF